MRKIMLTFAVLFTLGTAITTFTSCRDTKSTGDKVEDAADDVGDAVEDVVE
jgi:hypothetical protein